MRDASVVAFWLSAADTLASGERDRARDEFNYYTQESMEFLHHQSIQLVPTRSESLVVVSPKGARRRIMLSGLDYPYGYVLVDPGYAEQILAGVYTDEELINAVTDYFDLSVDSASVRVAGVAQRRVVRSSREPLRIFATGNRSARRAASRRSRSSRVRDSGPRY